MTRYLEKKTKFSNSRHWELVNEFYSQVGFDAWANGQIPHYATSNPVIAGTYAELVLAFLRDLSAQGKTDQTIYLVELGAGHGRLCHYFFKSFAPDYKNSSVKLPPFCYVLSDVSQNNIDALNCHPKLQEYFNEGLLDLSFFDATLSDSLHLQKRNLKITEGSLKQPLILFANYFFDTIPQELYWIKEGHLYDCLVTISSDEKESLEDHRAFFNSPYTSYDYIPALVDDIKINSGREIIRDYLEELDRTHLLFPSTGIDCLQRLSKLSSDGYVLITADKGSHTLDSLKNRAPPRLVQNRCFSLSVNYNALKKFVHLNGGRAFFSDNIRKNIQIGCLMSLQNINGFRGLENACDKYLNDYCPNDFYILKNVFVRKADSLDYQEISSSIRLSHYDPRLFFLLAQRLSRIIPNLWSNEKTDLKHLLIKVWKMYYFIGEQTDILQIIGKMMMKLKNFNDAIPIFEESIHYFGEQKKNMLCLAKCYFRVGNKTQSSTILDKLKKKHGNLKKIRKLEKRSR